MGFHLAASGQAIYDAYVLAEAGQLTNRNLLHNGAMQVQQRGTASTGITTSGYYTADRWITAISALGTWTQSIENDAPTGSGFRKSLKYLVTTADAAPAVSDFIICQQYLEGQDLQRIAKGTSSAQQITLSFWVKSSTTGTYVAELADGDNSRSVSASYAINAAGTWEKKTIVFPPDTTGAFDNDNARSLDLNFWLAVGTNYSSGTLATSWATTTSANRAVGQTNLAATINNYWQITGVQLEVGPVATPFEFKSYAQELRECQRYYYKLFPGAVSYPMGFGGNSSTTVARIAIPFQTTMRSMPSALEQTGTANQYAVFQPAIGATQCSVVPAHFNANTGMAIITATVASGLTQFYPVTLYTDATNGATAYLAWSADL